MNAYSELIRGMVAGQRLGALDAARLMREIVRGKLADSQIAAALTVLASRGETADELEGFATVMRQASLRVEVEGDLLDTCGTGGSGLPTVNTSTISAFVVAAAGVKIAKHGNRASSGKCGSMDVLEHLGADIDLTPARAERILSNGPIVFMNARGHHPGVAHATAVRRALGFRTVFNFLGPICNPANTTLQVLGVSDPNRAPRMVESLRRLGSKHVYCVWGEDGLDEISLAAPTRVWELKDGVISEFTIRPEDFGLKTVEFSEIAGGALDENQRHFMAILDGSETGARRTHVALNAGAGLYVGGAVATVGDGVDLAFKLIRSGEARETFDAYVAATREQE
ncbi:MAG: anthranilate phosphoribosyltransferase [Bradymonadia bacterium]|jgi:anthranilate phosphoribosyltransferase